MNRILDGNALVYCEGAFNTPNGKTAHGLIRFTERYNVLGLVDSRYAGKDALEVLDGRKSDIPVFASTAEALEHLEKAGTPVSYFVIGLAPDGGRLPATAMADIRLALEKGCNVDSGLHDFLSDKEDLMALATEKGVQIRDIRKPPERKDLHFFSGKIEQVDCLKIAILGTDSAIGKRTTAWILVHGLRNAGLKAEMVGTGQTAWMQGAKYALVLDSLINDFVSGEIEHATYEAWKNESPDAIIIEGQGSLMNPAYPGGFEILAAGRPDIVVLQHAPARLEYDGFPGYFIQPLKQQIAALEMISSSKVVAVTINHEELTDDGIRQAEKDILAETGLPAFDVLRFGPEGLVGHIQSFLR